MFSIIHSFDSSTKCQLWQNSRNCIKPLPLYFLDVCLDGLHCRRKKTQHSPMVNEHMETIRCIQFAYSKKRDFLFIIKYIREMPWVWHPNAGISSWNFQRQYIWIQKLPHAFIQVDMQCMNRIMTMPMTTVIVWLVVHLFMWNHCIESTKASNDLSI